MTYKELKKRYRKITDLISGKQIKDALDELAVLCRNCRNTDLVSQLEGHTQTYLNILKYSFEVAGDDPEKEKVYHRLLRSVLGLADDIADDIIRSGKLVKYYEIYATSEGETERVSAEMARLAERIKLKNQSGVSGDIDNNEVYRNALHKLFAIILLTNKLSEKNISLLDKVNDPEGLPWHDKSLIVSALTLSLLRYFDTGKVNMLFRFYESGEHQVWQRALLGLVIVFAHYDYRIEYYPELINRLTATQGMHDLNKTVENIIIQYIKAKETEKVTRKIRDEILPEMIRIKSRLEEKLDLDNILTNLNPEEKNPEWENFFKETPGVYNKLEEFTKMQMEGADVFMGAFAMLKGFEFFSHIHNWFLPFYKDNEHISPSLAGGNQGYNINELLEGIERSTFLCNSDKYSFCLNLKQMSVLQKSSMMEFFNAELKAMNELSGDEELINAESRNKAVITQYFQDLYRFFRLHPLHHEFEDIFNLSNELHNTRFFRIWVDDTDTLRNIGEFFFEKEYYRDALNVFSNVVIIQQNYEIFEKMAYSYQKLADFDKALEYYHKAELYGHNKIWLMNRIAYCSRKRGDYDTALDYYGQAENLDPDNKDIQLSFAQTYLEMEKYQDALKYYFRIEYSQPDNYRVYRPIAWCSFMLGKFETARKYLSRSIDIAGNRHDYMNMGHICWVMGDKKEAIDNYRKSLSAGNMDFELFSKSFSDDGKYLISNGINKFDIVLMLDYIKLTSA